MLSKVEASLVDPMGQLFEADDCFYRAIKPEFVEFVREVLDSGLIDALYSEGLFPGTDIASIQIEGHPLVLRHAKVGVPTYPFEWSPEMLRAAGLCVAAVNDICSRFGYELKDGHPFNVVFDGCRPVFVDFGSISPQPQARPKYWSASSEFERTFRMPLYFYAKGAHSLFRNAYLAPGKSYGYSEYFAFRSSVFRSLPARIRSFIAIGYEAYIRFPRLEPNKIGRRWGSWPQSFVRALQRTNLVPLSRRSTRHLRKRLNNLNIARSSDWSDYQKKAGYIDSGGTISMDERFGHVVKMVKAVRPRTVTELAGNQGILAEQISKLDFVDRVICCDMDERAIDSLFKRLGSHETRLQPMVLDFMLPCRNVLATPVEDRIRSDLIIALAVTHHLALSQGYTFESIFRMIARYTDRHAIVEFMPLGLWNGTYAPPLPRWYSEQAFQDGLKPFFKTLESRQLQENRIMYILERRFDGTQARVG